MSKNQDLAPLTDQIFSLRQDIKKTDLRASFIRRAGGVEVRVDGNPESAKALFVELCAEFEGFPGYSDPKQASRTQQVAAYMAGRHKR